MESSLKDVENAEDIEGNGDDVVKIEEGRGFILFSSSNEVFYNPVQELNRDLRYYYAESCYARRNVKTLAGMGS